MSAMEHDVVTQPAIVPLLSLLCFKSLPNKRLGGPGIMKVCDFRHCANILITNDKMLIKTSFTSSVLLPENQKSLLLLDVISKPFCYTNLGIRCYCIINLNGFINYKRYQ